MSEKIPEEDLLSELRRISEEHRDGKSPRIKDIEDYGKYSQGAYHRRYGGLTQALKEVDMEPNVNLDITEQDLIQDIKRVSENHCDGEAPTVKDMEKYGSYSSSKHRNHFGSWSKAIKEVGFGEKHQSEWALRGEENPLWEGGEHKEKDYGASWKPQRRKARERDNYECRVCGAGEEKYERIPDCHHIEPSENWNIEEEHEEMNSLDNLVCLCSSCHMKFEGNWQECEVEEFIQKAKNELY